MKKIFIILLLSSPIIAKKEITTSDRKNEGNQATYKNQYQRESEEVKKIMKDMPHPMCLFVLRNLREQNKNNPNPRLDAIKDLLLQVEKLN